MQNIVNTQNTSRRELLDLASKHQLTVVRDRYGVPRQINGAVLGEHPWKELYACVNALEYQLAENSKPLEPKQPVLVETPAPTPVINTVPWDFVGKSEPISTEGRESGGPASTPTSGHLPHPQITNKPKKHPLRGYTVYDKTRFLQGVHRKYGVRLHPNMEHKLLARILAKTLCADVRIRRVEGVPHLLIQKEKLWGAFAA